jgi:galactokinase
MGSGRRCLSHLAEAKTEGFMPNANRFKVNKIRKMLKAGCVPIIHKLVCDLTTEDASTLEILLIAEIGTVREVEGVSKRGPLANLHRGGYGGFDQANAIKHREKRGRAISEALRKPEVHAKIVETRRKNGWYSQEALDRRAELVASGAFKHTDEKRQRIASSTKEAMQRSEVLARMKESAQKRWSDPAEGEKIRNQNSKTFMLTHRETGEQQIIKNMTAFCKLHKTYHQKVYKEYEVTAVSSDCSG